MIINDPIFGNLEFDIICFRYDTITFLDKETEIIIIVSEDEDGKFEAGQYEAYQEIMKNWDKVHVTFPEAILEYYKQLRKELGYDIEVNDRFPQIDTTEQLLNHITLTGIKVQFANIFGGRSIGVSFDCTWDEENGVGLALSDEKIIEIGYKDVAL